MKQKYKVFINDNSLEFLEKAPEGIDPTHCYADSYDAMALVQKISRPGTGGPAGFPAPLSGSATAPEHFYCVSGHPHQAFEIFTGNFQTIKAAGGIVKRSDNENLVLMIYRLGKWDLPKGKTEKGESAEESALREVAEECGIGHLKIIRKLPVTWHMYFHKGNWVVKETDWFEMLTNDQSPLTPQESEGITGVQWVHQKDIPALLNESYASIASLLKDTVLNR